MPSQPFSTGLCITHDRPLAIEIAPAQARAGRPPVRMAASTQGNTRRFTRQTRLMNFKHYIRYARQRMNSHMRALDEPPAFAGGEASAQADPGRARAPRRSFNRRQGMPIVVVNLH